MLFPRNRIFILNIILNNKYEILVSNLDIQRAKRGKLFLKGPIYFEGSGKADPTARLLLVARAFMDMDK